MIYRNFLLLLMFLLSAMAGYTQAPFAKNIKRILFLGNSISYTGLYIMDIEAWMLNHYPNQRYEFMNVSVPSETVSGLSEANHAKGKFPRPDLHERLQRVLDSVKPDMVFACYGMNDGIYQPLDEARLKAFKDGIVWLHESLQKAGVKRIVHITPPTHDDKKLRTRGYNKVLDAYSKWMVSLRKKKKWEVADLHGPMTKYIEEGIAKNSSFRLAKDGIHPGEDGHWVMARIILQHLKQKPPTNRDTALLATPQNREIFTLVKKRQEMMRDAWLTATKPKRPGLKAGIPLEDAWKKYAEIETHTTQLLNEAK